MTNEKRIETLQTFGYTEREAAFLCLAALHSGYFLRRQYIRFLGGKRGYGDDVLVEKARSLGHAKEQSSCNKVKVYHLSSHPFYLAIGESDNRHRRRRAPLAVKAKLMGLDYVLSHRQVPYLATEQEKVTYFQDTLGIDSSQFPTKLYRSTKSGAVTERYFVDKYPIFLSAEPGAAAPVVSCCYVDEGVHSISGFETYLKQYAALLAGLRRFQLIYVAARARHFEAAKGRFSRFVEGLVGSQNGRVDEATAELLDYFELRRLYEAKEFRRLDRAKLDRLSGYMHSLESPNLEEEYRLWLEGGVEGLLGPNGGVKAASGGVEAKFSTYRLHENYDLFGTLAASD